MSPSAFDKAHPEYQRELGFVPCRAEDCDIIECHALHGEAVAVAVAIEARKPGRARTATAAHMQTLRERYQLRQRVAAVANAKAILEGLDIYPKLVHETEGGTIIAIEWTCPMCSGQGWRQTAAESCRFCHGHGSVDLTYESRLALVHRGLVKRKAP